MELAFETKLLREVCESAEKAKQQFGAEVARALKRLLADLRAAGSIEDLPVAKPRRISGNCVFQLSTGHILTATANHPVNPLLKSGEIDWAKVERIRILRIEGAT